MSRGFLGLGLLLLRFSGRGGVALKIEEREKELWAMFRGLRREWGLWERRVLNKDMRGFVGKMGFGEMMGSEH